VETLSRYITFTATEWQSKLDEAGSSGSGVILQKLDIVKRYMQNAWGVDVNQLKNVIQRRANDIQHFDFDNLENLPMYPFLVN